MNPELYIEYQNTNRIIIFCSVFVIMMGLLTCISIRNAEISADKLTECIRITQKPLECKAAQ